jgi:hypothetical protein
MSFRKAQARADGWRTQSQGHARVATITNFVGQEFIHLASGQRLELQIGCIDFREESLNLLTVVGHGSRGQPAFLDHVVREWSDQIGIGAMDGGRCLQSSQEGQPPNRMADKLATLATHVSHLPPTPSTFDPALRCGDDLGSRDKFTGPLRQTQGSGDDEGVAGDVPQGVHGHLLLGAIREVTATYLSEWAILMTRDIIPSFVELPKHESNLPDE